METIEKEKIYQLGILHAADDEVKKSLPKYYVHRPKLIVVLIKATEVLKLIKKPEVLLHAMPGAGKSSLCKELFLNKTLTNFYPGGIILIEIGSKKTKENYLENLEIICNYLEKLTSLKTLFGGGEGAVNGSQVKKMNELMRILLVVDDVWTREQAESYLNLNLTISVNCEFSENNAQTLWSNCLAGLINNSNINNLTSELSSLCQYSPITTIVKSSSRFSTNL